MCFTRSAIAYIYYSHIYGLILMKISVYYLVIVAIAPVLLPADPWGYLHCLFAVMGFTHPHPPLSKATGLGHNITFFLITVLLCKQNLCIDC